MKLWLVRAGRHGEREEICLTENRVGIGWVELPNISGVGSREELKTIIEKTYPTFAEKKIIHHVGQIWAFLKKIEKGDWVVLPLKHQPAIAIGEVIGNYEHTPQYGTDFSHTRKVKWLNKGIPRTEFDQDILYSFGAFTTVCQISRHNALERIKAIVEGRKLTPLINKIVTEDTDVDLDEIQGNFEDNARTQIIQRISENFTGHRLADLVAEILKIQGYTIKVSPPGRDGGVDILAGSGPLGLGDVRLAVQVKSSSSPIDVQTYRSLHGTMKSFQATKGLFVAWGGFNRDVLSEAKNSFFDVRLWDQNDLLNQLFDNYFNLSEAIRAELPLKRIWSLVLEDEI